MKKNIKKTVIITEETEVINEKTAILAILDRSGSMTTIIDDMIGGFNQFLKSQKELAEKALLSVVLFDDRYELLYNNVDLKEAKNITKKDWSPRGTTALYDAIGRGVNDLKSNIKKMDKSERPDKVLVCIVTDGHENASTEYTAQMVKELIKKMENKDWNFVYLGANQNAFAVGTDLGFSGGNTFTYTADSVGAFNSFDNLTNATKKYRSLSKSAVNYTATINNLLDLDNVDLTKGSGDLSNGNVDLTKKDDK